MTLVKSDRCVNKWSQLIRITFILSTKQMNLITVIQSSSRTTEKHTCEMRLQIRHQKVQAHFVSFALLIVSILRKGHLFICHTRVLILRFAGKVYLSEVLWKFNEHKTQVKRAIYCHGSCCKTLSKVEKGAKSTTAVSMDVALVCCVLQWAIIVRVNCRLLILVLFFFAISFCYVVCLFW